MNCASQLMNFCINFNGLCINNDELCINNDELCIQKYELCITAAGLWLLTNVITFTECEYCICRRGGSATSAGG